MGAEDEAFPEVVRFIRQQATLPIPEIGWSTTIERDLGISGIDSGELMETFFERFDVSPVGFRFDSFFMPEGVVIPLLTPILCWLISGERMPPPPSYDLTVGDLVRCVRAGKWVEPEATAKD